MIGIEAGVQAYESARGLVLAAAYAVAADRLSLRLAPSRPLRAARLDPVRFRRDHPPVLASAARELRAVGSTG
jgi:hypothetical protein